MQINRSAIAFLLALVSTAPAVEVKASKKATRKTQKNYGGNTAPYVYQLLLFILLLFSYNSYCRFHSIVIDAYSIEFTSFLLCFSFSLFLYLLSIANGDDFDEVFRDFHATVDHATAMVGYENARADPLLDGREYATTFSIMEALGNSNPEDFVKIFHDRFWDDKSIDGRRLSTIWEKIGKAFKCAGIAIGTGVTCTTVVTYCSNMVNATKTNCRGKDW